MAVAIRVEAAVLGRKRAGVAERDVSLELDPDPTLRDVIAAVVASEVAEFDRRREERTFISVLTEHALADGTERGAIRSGGADAGATVSIAAATSTALLAFEDGLYQVYIDDEPIESLDHVVQIGAGTRLMFLRLVALAGG